MRSLSTFDWLLLGHLVGDWLLQNDWMAKGKTRSLLNLAGTVHFTIYTTIIIGALWLSGVRDKDLGFYLVISAIMFVSHWLVDATRLADRWMRLYRQSDLQWVRMVVDQTFHILILAAITYLVLIW